MLQPTSSSSPQIGGGSNFVADFSAIKALDTISTEIDDVKKYVHAHELMTGIQCNILLPLYREKQQLQQDIVAKQDILAKSKEEAVSLQADLQETNRQREQLEKQKQTVTAQLEEIENQVDS